MRNWLRASSMMFNMCLIPIFAAGCDSRKSSNESSAPTASAKHAAIKTGVGTFSLTLPEGMFDEPIARVDVTLTGDSSYSRQFNEDEDIRFDGLAPGVYVIDINLFLTDVSLVDHTGTGQVEVHPQRESSAKIELNPASMNGSVNIEITKGDGKNSSFKIGTIKSYDCFDLETDSVVTSNLMLGRLGDCYGLNYDFKFAWNGNVNLPAFFFNESEATAQVMDKAFKDIGLNDTSDLCVHLNDPKCSQQTWLLSTARTGVIKTKEGNLYKVAITEENPSYEGIVFKYEKIK